MTKSTIKKLENGNYIIDLQENAVVKGEGYDPITGEFIKDPVYTKGSKLSVKIGSTSLSGDSKKHKVEYIVNIGEINKNEL